MVGEELVQRRMIRAEMESNVGSDGLGPQKS